MSDNGRKVPTPNWTEWLHIPEPRAWEACALSLNIEPHSMRHLREGWMHPDGGPYFEPESFPDDSIKAEFELRARVLLANLHNRSFFSPGVLNMRRPANHGVNLTEFSVWATQQVQWKVPEELRTLAAAHTGDATEVEQEEEEDAWFMARVTETVYNGTVIDWHYWVHLMPKLKPIQATRLMSALDPNLFEDLSQRPTRNDPTKMCTKAKAMQQLAEAEEVLMRTPPEWLTWADDRGFQVHRGYKLAIAKFEPPSAEAGPGVAVSQPIVPRQIRTAERRRNILDPAIDIAVSEVGKDVAAVFLRLRDMALDEHPPFTGAIEGDALLYTSTNNETLALSRDALSKRLARRFK